MKPAPSPTASTGRAGRDEQVRALFDADYRRLVQLAVHLVGNLAEAEEVTQDAFAELYRRWERVLNPGGYLRTSVVNGSRRVVRRRLQRDTLHQQLGNTQSPAAGPGDYLLDALDRLPERQRTAIVLAYYGDFTANEIAQAIGCRPGTAKSLVHRGLKRLERDLDHG